MQLLLYCRDNRAGQSTHTHRHAHTGTYISTHTRTYTQLVAGELPVSCIIYNVCSLIYEYFIYAFNVNWQMRCHAHGAHIDALWWHLQFIILLCVCVHACCVCHFNWVYLGIKWWFSWRQRAIGGAIAVSRLTCRLKAGNTFAHNARQRDIRPEKS